MTLQEVYLQLHQNLVSRLYQNLFGQTEAALDIIARGGRTREGAQIYSDQDTAGDRNSKIFAHLVKAQMPFSLDQLKRLDNNNIKRIKNDNFKLVVHKPIFFSNNDTIEHITLRLNKILEQMIMKNPEQWIWTHNRWK